MRRQRGSAMLFVIIMTVAITSVVIATSDLTMSAIKVVRQQELAARAKCALDGITAKNISDYKKSILVLGSSHSEAVGSLNPSTTPSDYSATIWQTLKFDNDTAVGGKTFRNSIVLGNRKPAKPSFYALFSDGDIQVSDTLTTGSGGVNGDICTNGDLRLDAVTNTINGDAEANTMTLADPTDVVGNSWPGAPAITFPTFVRANYTAAANTTLAGNQTLNNYVFISPYRLVVITGNLTISGIIAGTGVFYVTGNVTINNDMFYLDASSRMAIISEGDVTWKNNANTAVGYFYTAGQFRTNGSGARALTRGGIACNTCNIGCDVTIIHDPRVWTSATEGANLKLPGFWP